MTFFWVFGEIVENRMEQAVSVENSKFNWNPKKVKKTRFSVEISVFGKREKTGLTEGLKGTSKKGGEEGY